MSTKTTILKAKQATVPDTKTTERAVALPKAKLIHQCDWTNHVHPPHTKKHKVLEILTKYIFVGWEKGSGLLHNTKKTQKVCP